MMRVRKAVLCIALALVASISASPNAQAVPFSNGTNFYPGEALTLTGTDFSTANTIYLVGNSMFPSYHAFIAIPTFRIISDTAISLVVPPPSAFGSPPGGVLWVFQVKDSSNHWTAAYSTLIAIPAPVITLSQSSETATVGSAIAGYSISSTGGTVASYSISPDISAIPNNGLSFDTNTGLISGTPTATAAPITYTITGTNPTSSSSATYTIGVEAIRAVATPVPIPDPLQQSSIVSFSPDTSTVGVDTPVVVSGIFREKVSAIQVNGVGLSSGSWVQTPTTISFTLPSKSAGVYSIQIFNGSAPVLPLQQLKITAPFALPTPIAAPKKKVIYISCKRSGHGSWISYGVDPTCPAGYTKNYTLKSH